MQPKFQAGDFVLVRKLIFKKPKVNDILVVNHPHYGQIIKQVKSVKPNGISMCSSNKSGLSEQAIGLVNPAQIIGKVIHHFSKSI